MESFKKAEGIKGTITPQTLDEAPMAYKDIDKVMKAQEKSGKINKAYLANN